MANTIRAFVFSHSPGPNALWHSPSGMLPNQRSMRFLAFGGFSTPIGQFESHKIGRTRSPSHKRQSGNYVLKFTPMGRASWVSLIFSEM
ncbi:hypothetical protein J4G08_08270 [Candidatus Poribacteria bacterium]|nr:hypothetical protein [Candidatus Poribacteria bacterium]